MLPNKIVRLLSSLLLFASFNLSAMDINQQNMSFLTSLPRGIFNPDLMGTMEQNIAIMPPQQHRVMPLLPPMTPNYYGFMNQQSLAIPTSTMMNNR